MVNNKNNKNNENDNSNNSLAFGLWPQTKRTFQTKTSLIKMLLAVFVTYAATSDEMKPPPPCVSYAGKGTIW